MNNKVSYGSLDPIVIGGLAVIVAALLRKARNGEASTVSKSSVANAIQLNDGGIWGDESGDPDNDPQVFRVADFISDFRLDYNAAPLRSIPENKLEQFSLNDKDILVVKSSGSANQVVSGRVALFRSQQSRKYAASNFLMRIRARDGVDPRYLAFVLGSPPIRESVAESVKTMTYPNLSFKIYGQVEIPMVALEDQLVIAEFFEALLEQRTLPELPPYLADEHKTILKLSALNKLLSEAETLRNEVGTEVNALIISLHTKLAGSRTVELRDLLRLDEDVVTLNPTDEYPQVGVRGFGAGLFPKAAIMGSETTYKVFNRLYDGAVVLSQVKGWEGAVAVCPSNLAGWYVSPEYRTFRCIEGQARPRYLATLLRTEWFWERLKEATRGVGARRERTRPEQFLAIRLPMPTAEQQAAGERVFQRIDELQHVQRDTLKELTTLRASLIRSAMNAQLMSSERHFV